MNELSIHNIFNDTIKQKHDLNSSNNKTFYFKFTGNKKALHCIKNDVLVVNSSEYRGIWIKLSFRNILRFATGEQKILYDQYRKKYINGIMKSIWDNSSCGTLQYEIIGSNSYVSDVDVFIYKLWSNNISPTNSIRKCLSKIVDKIHQHHHKTYEQSLEELFDCNIYITSFFYYTKTQINNSKFFCLQPKDSSNMYLCFTKLINYDLEQRKWACYKIATNLKKYKSDILLRDLKKHFPTYSKLISLSCVLDVQKYKHKFDMQNTTEMLSSTSSFSTTEKDTYHTLGAVLANVIDKSKYPQLNSPHGNDEYITIAMYIDSVLDNLGFIYNIVFHKSDTCDDDDYKLIKISKYLYRICFAFGKIITKHPEGNKSVDSMVQMIETESNILPDSSLNIEIQNFLKITEYSFITNEERKRLTPVTKNKRNARMMMNALHIYCIAKNFQLKRSSQDSLLNELSYITYFVLSMTKQYDDYQMMY